MSSVSRVLNNHPYVSDEARGKILQIVRELDYTPNLVAKELSLGNTYKVGVVIPHVRHTYLPSSSTVCWIKRREVPIICCFCRLSMIKN
ncbi:LacI family DNA-binding transcriptional regulator [Streptococcus anginosus]|uniref:LacI family DNA-binding transcriptional regulator n=1 Tax=Streptococcus anginosus TaxID=1328 RepID=UPI0030C7C483